MYAWSCKDVEALFLGIMMCRDKFELSQLRTDDAAPFPECEVGQKFH